MVDGAAVPENYGEVYEVVDRAFKKARLEKSMIRIIVNEDPKFQKGDLRVAKADGKIVSMMMIVRRPLRIGTAIVNGAIVAPVATHPDYQKKGYCSAVMRDAVRYMEAQGFDLTILWGIPWLYPHYGYSPAMVKTEIVITAKQADLLKKQPYEFKSLTEADLEQITRIYHKNTATRTCAELRSPTMWEWKPEGSEAKLEVIADEKGRVIGYVALGTDWGRPCAHEIGVSNEEASGAVFNHLLEIIKSKGLKEFYCIIHPDHPFARFAFWRNSEMRIQSGGGAGMARVLNPVSLLTKMEQEFERRLNHSELQSLGCTLKISSEEGVATLDIDHGRVSATADNSKTDYGLDISLSSLNPLITGYKNIEELLKNAGVMVKGGKPAVRLIQVLFPSRFPYGGLLPLVWE